MKMKRIFLNFILIVLIYNSGFCQKFTESKEFSLTKFTYSEFMKLENENENFDGYMSVFIKNKNNIKIKELKVYGESYENTSTVFELNNSGFKNVRKIIKVSISECACYCNTSTYFWIITMQNKWIEIPVIEEEEDYEFEMKSKDYKFFIKNSNEIILVEYQDEFIEKGNYDIKNIRRKSKKTLKKISWDGNKISEIAIN